MDSPLLAHLPPTKIGGRIALLGGSFNPIHLGHALLAHAVLASEGFTAVWVLPCADHPFGKALAPFADRLHMCSLGMRHLGEAVQIVDIESRLGSPSFTVQTLRAIKGARPDLALAFIVGSDILPELPNWKEPDELRRLCDLLVLPRDGHPIPNDASLIPTRLGFPLPEVSSSAVRARVAAGADPTGLVTPQVAAHIRDRGLYRSNAAVA